MGLFFTSKAKSSSTTRNTSETFSDQDNLAADNGADVNKQDFRNDGDVYVSDAGAVEAIGRTVDLVQSVSDGLFQAQEVSALQTSLLQSQAVQASKADTTELAEQRIGVTSDFVTFGLPAVAIIFIGWMIYK